MRYLRLVMGNKIANARVCVYIHENYSRSESFDELSFRTIHASLTGGSGELIPTTLISNERRSGWPREKREIQARPSIDVNPSWLGPIACIETSAK